MRTTGWTHTACPSRPPSATFAAAWRRGASDSEIAELRRLADEEYERALRESRDEDEEFSDDESGEELGEEESGEEESGERK